MNRTTAALGSILFFFLAPGIVAGAIPSWISGWRLPEPLPAFGLGTAVGALVLAAGLWVLIDSFVRFARNLGTPAPVAPTRHLVVDGWYRFVRNPMYVAVLSIIVGQGLIFWLWPIIAYGAVVFLTVHLFVIGYEEPTLREQFPTEYETYFANVHRWLPRLTPWRGPVSGR